MPEIRTKVAYVEVDMICDRCGVGRMRLKVTKPILVDKIHVHECNNCGYIENYSVRYPYIDKEQ